MKYLVTNGRKQHRTFSWLKIGLSTAAVIALAVAVVAVWSIASGPHRLASLAGRYEPVAAVHSRTRSVTAAYGRISPAPQVLGVSTTPKQSFQQQVASLVASLSNALSGALSSLSSSAVNPSVSNRTTGHPVIAISTADTSQLSAQLSDTLSSLQTLQSQVASLPLQTNAVETTSVNLIQNSSFEANSSGPPLYWSYLGQSTSANTFVNNASIRSGNNALRIQPSGGASRFGIYQPSIVTLASHAYTLSLYVKNATGQNPTLELSFWDHNNNRKAISKQYTLTNLSDWVRYSFTLDPPSQGVDGNGFFPMIEVLGASSGNVYIDDVQLSEGMGNSTFHRQGMTIGDGSVVVDASGNIYPAIMRSGSLGSANYPFNTLNLTAASIDQSGNTSLGGNLTTSGSGTFGGSVSVAGSTTISGNLTVSGTTNVSGSTSFTADLVASAANTYNLGSASVPWKSLYLGSAATIGGNLAVNGGGLTTTASTFNLLNSTATTVNFGGAATSLSIGASSGTTTINNNLAVTGTSAFSSTLTLSGTSSSSGNALCLSVSNQIVTCASGSSISGLGVSGQLGFWTGTSTLSGNTNLFWDNTNNRLGIGTSAPDYTLKVNGTGFFSGFVGIGSSLNVSGNVGVGASFNTASIGVFGGLSVSGLSSLGAVNTAAINSTTINATSLTTSGNVAVGSSLTTTSAASLNSLNVVGVSALNNTGITGTLNVSGNTGIGGSLTVTGASTLSSTLGVTGLTTASGGLTVPSGQNLTLSGFTTGSVLFAGASGVISQNNSQLFWDNTNYRLGIGTTAPVGAPAGSLAVGGQTFMSPPGSLIQIPTEKDLSGNLLPYYPGSFIHQTSTQVDATGVNMVGTYSRIDCKSGGVFLPGPKTGCNPFYAREESLGQASSVAYSYNLRQWGLGDAAALGGDSLYTSATPTAGGTEALELISGSPLSGVIGTMTVTGSPSSSATAISYSGATNDTIVGIGRLIVNTSKTKTGGTITAISGTGASGENASTATVTGSGTNFLTGDVGRCFAINADSQTIDSVTVNAWYIITAVDSTTSMTIEAGFGGNRTFPTAGYTIADCSRTTASTDTTNHVLTIGANSFAWSNGDALQAVASVHGNVAGGSITVQKLFANSTRPIVGYFSTIAGNVDGAQAYTITRSGSRIWQTAYDTTNGVTNVAFDARGATVSALDINLGVPIRWGGSSWNLYAGSPNDGGGNPQVHLQYSGSDKLRVDSSGNVGIGNTNPQTLLYVTGNAMIGYSSGAPGSLANGLAVSGNVGIGTTSPGSILDMSTGTQNSGIRLNYQNSGNTYLGTGLYISGTEKWFTGIDGANSNRDYIVRVNGATNVLTAYNSGGVANTLVLSAGNVGIGTTSPGSKLEVDTGADSTKGIILKGNSPTQSADLFEVQKSDGTIGVTLGYLGTQSDMWLPNVGRILFRNAANNANLVAYQVDGGNNMIVGPGAAGATVSLRNGSGGTIDLQNNAGSPLFRAQEGDPENQIYIRNDSWKGLVIKGNSLTQSADLQQWQKSDGTVLMTVQANGNVGIGISAPSYHLDVNGGARFACGNSTWNSGPTTTCSDVAEAYQTSDKSLQAGDVISLSETSGTVNKTRGQYDPKIIGVFSTSPGLLVGGQAILGGGVTGLPSGSVPVALSGRAPVKISTENGPIALGDYLTSSSEPGIAMKAVRAGEVIGKAMEAFNGTGGTDCANGFKCSKILAFVNVGFADPNGLLGSLMLDSSGNLVAKNASTIWTSVAGAQVTPTPDSTPSATLTALAGPSLAGSALNGLQNDIASLSARLAHLETKLAPLSTDASASASVILALTPPEQLLASSSAVLAADLAPASQASISGSLQVNQAVVSETLKSLGNSILGNTIIAGSLAVDGTLAVSGNSLSAIGTLHLQNGPLAQGLNVLNGAVTIDKGGNIVTIGTVTASKAIAAPDLIGNKLHLTSSPIASTSAVAGASLGRGTILAGKTTVTVNTAAVNDSSEIFVTATSATGGEALVVTDQKTGQGFTVGVDHPYGADMKFNWWIVDSK